MKNIFYFTTLIFIMLISGISAIYIPASNFLYFFDNTYSNFVSTIPLYSYAFHLFLPVITFVVVFGYSILYGLAIFITYCAIKENRKLKALISQLLPITSVLFTLIFLGFDGIKSQFSFLGGS